MLENLAGSQLSWLKENKAEIAVFSCHYQLDGCSGTLEPLGSYGQPLKEI